MPRTKERSCGIKRQYSTRRIARNVARTFRNRDHPTLAPYRCEFCQFYHIGHGTPKRAQPMAEKA